MAGKKGNFLTKKVPFGGKEMTLYSIDGVTWSTRPDELQSIIERHSNEQKGFSDDLQGKEKDKTAQPEKPKAKRFQKVHNDDEIDEVIEDDLYPEDDYEDYEDEVAEDGDNVVDSDDELKSKKQKGANAKIESPKKAAGKSKADKGSKATTPVRSSTKPQAAKPAAKKPTPSKKAPVAAKKEKSKGKSKKR